MRIQRIKNKHSYWIQEDGLVWSTKSNRFLKPSLSSNGYHMSAGMYIHRLLALAFLPNPLNKPHVNHKNGIKCDNRLDNLEWATPSENELHKHRVLKIGIKEGHYASKITQHLVDRIRKEYMPGYGNKVKLAKKYNLSPEHIKAIVDRRIWR